MEFLNQWFWFVLLLPLAALTGWVVDRRGGQRHGDTQVSRLSSTYFRGLNYLLNEQPDKAIELFLHVAELDRDTFETQVALGHLFRRRGEVDRAIRLHQALAQRPDLSDLQKIQALSALGEDYMRAGLLDRAMPFGPAPAGLYGLLAETLDRLAGHSPGPAFLPRFELRLLRELGLAPGWDFCTQCRADLRTGAAARLDAVHGALRCEACAAGRGLPVSAATLAAIRRMQGPELPDSLPERVFREIRAAAGGLLEHHAEFPPASRELTFQILAVG